MKFSSAAIPIQINPASILLKLNAKHEVIQLLSGEKIKALDIGCEIPFYLYDLYHDVGVSDITAFESESFAKVLRKVSKGWHDKFRQRLKQMSSKGKFDIYDQFYVKPAEVGTFDVRPALTTPKDFNNVFKIWYKKEWDGSQTKNQTFDYIILSNTLHLIVDHVGWQDTHQSRTKEFFDNALGNLRPGGFMYIRVPYQDSPNVNKWKHIRFNEGNFKKLIGKSLNELFFVTEPNHDGSIQKNSMIFLGQKK